MLGRLALEAKLGLPPGEPEWGVMVNDGRNHLLLSGKRYDVITAALILPGFVLANVFAHAHLAGIGWAGRFHETGFAASSHEAAASRSRRSITPRVRCRC